MLKKLMTIVVFGFLQVTACASDKNIKDQSERCMERVAYFAANADLAQTSNQKKSFEAAMYNQLNQCLSLKAKPQSSKLSSVDLQTPSYGDDFAPTHQVIVASKKITAQKSFYDDTPEC